MAKTQQEQAAPDLIEVVIAVENHTHAGEPVAKGNKISVDAETAAWLKQHKIIEE